MTQWWQIDIETTAKNLGSDLSAGLNGAEATARLGRFGYNRIEGKKGLSPFAIFLAQFKDFIIWVLIGAALVSGFLQEWVDALAIIAIVILNAILGFIQEYRAEKSLAALKKLASPTSKVIRDGQHVVISSFELVPGDLIELEAGDNIPADSRIVWLTANFAVQEASLTGESTPVAKTSDALQEKEVPLAERANMVYMGTSVAGGKAKAIAAETGMRTELGKIADMIQEIHRDSTPLQQKLEQFSKWIVYLCFVLVGLVFLLGVLRGGKVLDMFLTAVSLAVAAIPEGLPAVVTIALALGVQRMVARHALIRKLPSVETLGCATVICSDKTGTLTKNEMTVQAIYAGGTLFRISGIGYEPKGDFLLDDKPIKPADYPTLARALFCGTLCNGAQLIRDGDTFKIFGDPTEAAILTAAAKADIWKEKAEQDRQFVTEIPFDSERKKMTIIRRQDNKLVAYVKGAPDVLLNNCTKIETGGATRNLTEKDVEDIAGANNHLANDAMRGLGLAYRELDNDCTNYQADVIEKELTFVGLVAMIDPPREEVKKAIADCKTASIRTVMITGDHKNTAVAIARQLGFFGPDSLALTGEELDKLSQQQLHNEIKNVSVYARVSPEHKLRVVRALRHHSEVVAMTGDGVNDAPAVKEADIGVAMGITGTDVTKEVSDMIITDDNFASIVAAVEEGRGIYDNIKKFIHYLLSCNTGEILVMFVSSLVGWPVPLLPIQILWVNLVTDGLPALALGVDPVDPNIMKRPPRPPKEPVVTRQRAFLMLAQGSFIALCSLVAFGFVLFFEKEGLPRARTAAFVVLACSQLFHAFNCRSQTESLFKIGVFTNPKLILANGVSFLLQMMVVYVPFLRTVFKTEMLSLLDWLMVIALSSLPLWAMEIIKAINKKNCLTGPTECSGSIPAEGP
ncbi:MAG: calcium-transporting P-type ATPase, PMR1-type [Sedimentisphaerales bacterium]|jgi:Ca2+-transporting ATPase